MDHLERVAMVAKLGNILTKTQKERNIWKMRMLKAGLESRGLSVPGDWETLPEDEKERRLDGAIKELQ